MASSVNKSLEEDFFEEKLNRLYYFDSDLSLDNLNSSLEIVKPEIAKPVIKTSTIIKKKTFIEKTNLSVVNVLLLFIVFSLVCVESFFYYKGVKIQTFLSATQKQVNKTIGFNDNLKIELAKTKELTTIENMAIKLYGMRTAENIEIKYLQTPKQDLSNQILIKEVLNKEKSIEIPTGL